MQTAKRKDKICMFVMSFKNKKNYETIPGFHTKPHVPRKKIA